MFVVILIIVDFTVIERTGDFFTFPGGFVEVGVVGTFILTVHIVGRIVVFSCGEGESGNG